jgi:plasmid stabilization system protein ParE
MRIAPYGNYLILFRIAKDTVEIRRVVHGARSLKKLSL